MMKLEITNLDNAAFQDGNLQAEIASILQSVARLVELGQDSGICRDSNGNKVGQWSISQD